MRDNELLIEIFAASADKQLQISTGYPIAPDCVITARHAVFFEDATGYNHRAAQIELRWHYLKGDWIALNPANCIVWQHDDFDVVLLRCPFPENAQRYGRLSQQRPQLGMEWGSEGFAEVGQRGNTRLPVKFWGDMPNAGNADQNTFVVRVKASTDNRDLLQGISGAPVMLQHDEILGIIESCPAHFDAERLHATASYQLLQISEFRQHIKSNSIESSPTCDKHNQKLLVKQEIIDTLAAGLTGLPKSYIPNAISNMHAATKKALEDIDPRLLVKTSHFDGTTSISIFAKEENVSFSMQISSAKIEDFTDKYHQLVECGKDIEIKDATVTIEGSDLLSILFDEINYLKIVPEKKKAVQKLWFIERDTNAIKLFDDIQGYISLGTKFFYFEGKACDGLLKFSCKEPLNRKEEKFKINISHSFKKWEGLKINNLPFFKTIYSLYNNMIEGWELFTSLEIDGNQIISSARQKVDKSDTLLNTYDFLHYIYCCKVISEKFNFDIRYEKNISLTDKEYENILEAVDVIEGKQNSDINKITEKIMCKLTVDNDLQNAKFLLESKSPLSIKIVQEKCDKIKLFGMEVTLPAKVAYFGPVLPKIHEEIDIDRLKGGDIIDIEWIPQSKFTYIINYDDN